MTLKPVNGARFPFVRVREGKSLNARRIVPLTDRAAAMLRERRIDQESEAAKRKAEGKDTPALLFVFANRDGRPYLGTSINHLHRDACAPKVDGNRKPIFSADFVLHSIRHTMLTRLGESGVDAFTIMRIAGHCSITVSQRYVHPTPEAVERAFERLQLSAARPENRAQRLPPATISATLPEVVSVGN